MHILFLIISKTQAYPLLHLSLLLFLLLSFPYKKLNIFRSVEKIVKIYRNHELESMRQASYARAEDFLTIRVEEAWRQLIEEVTHVKSV